MQYVSLDIETTGLNPKKNQIVEVGAVATSIGDTLSIEKLPRFRAVLIHESMTMDPFCANLHRDLWREIIAAKSFIGDEDYRLARYLEDDGKVRSSTKLSDNDTYYCMPDKFETLFEGWLKEVCPEAIVNIKNVCSTSSPVKINVAGKNVASFDIPFLEALPGWKGFINFRRRTIDPAILCVHKSDKHLPDLKECLTRCNIVKKVSHTAVDDALDIIQIIRACEILGWFKENE